LPRRCGALWCPVGTTRLRIGLANRGVGTATFRAVRLFAIAPGGP
jgi:hypothetical protein